MKTTVCKCGCKTQLIYKNHPETVYIKGHHKGNLGNKLTKDQKANISKGRIGKCLNETNPKWNNKVGYHGLHTWIQRKLGKAKECQKCGSTTRISWSNISYQYKRDLLDWEQLCQSCHFKKDYHSGYWGEARRMFSL